MSDSIFSKKAINATVANVQALAKRAPGCLIADVPLLDKSGEQDVPTETLLQVAEKVAQKINNVHLMLIAGGSTYCSIAVFTPDGAALGATDWLSQAGFTAVSSGTGGDSKTGCFATAVQVCDCPFKDKELLRTNAFNVLKVQQVYLDDASSSEEDAGTYFDINAD